MESRIGIRVLLRKIQRDQPEDRDIRRVQLRGRKLRQMIERFLPLARFHGYLSHLKIRVGIGPIDRECFEKNIARAIPVIRHQQMIAVVIQNHGRIRRLLRGLLVHLRRFGEFFLIVESNAQQAHRLAFIRMRLDLSPKLLLRDRRLATLQCGNGILKIRSWSCGSAKQFPNQQ